MKRTIVSLVLLASMFVVGAVPNAQAQQCSNASLKGSYGFYSTGTSVPAGTPRVALGREIYDGKGNFTNTVTVNSNGTVIHGNNFGTYTVNADCTGTLFDKVSGVTSEFVLVDGGKEIYTASSSSPLLQRSCTVLARSSSQTRTSRTSTRLQKFRLHRPGQPLPDGRAQQALATERRFE